MIHWLFDPSFGLRDLGLGFLVGWLLSIWWHQLEDKDEPESSFTATERAVIEAQFVEHATAVAEQVSAFADVLAGDDPLLRARLRKIEEARRWS